MQSCKAVCNIGKLWANDSNSFADPDFACIVRPAIGIFYRDR